MATEEEISAGAKAAYEHGRGQFINEQEPYESIPSCDKGQARGFAVAVLEAAEKVRAGIRQPEKLGGMDW
jgi:hypothetical protein